MNKTIDVLIFICVFLGLNALYAQATEKTYPFTSKEWTIQGDYELIQYDGKESLLFKEGGTAKLADVPFENGIIDYDLVVSPKRGFVGVKFRMQDDGNCEEFYIRMHQSGNPDATQYTPVFNGLAGWQLYHGENHSTAIAFKPDEWMHVRLAVFGDQMEIFVDDMEHPILHVYDLKRDEKRGYLGVYGSTTCHFANFKVTPLDTYTFKSPAKEKPKMAPGTIATWSVSEAFPVNKLTDSPTLPSDLQGALKWQNLKSDYTGIANLAKVAAKKGDANVVLAKVVIESDRDQVKELKFSYSDRARIYLNGTALYQGQRVFRSRDYRYLGTVGYFESVFLNLKKGRNEVLFAVAENFGGWGVMAKWVDAEGIQMVQ